MSTLSAGKIIELYTRSKEYDKYYNDRRRDWMREFYTLNFLEACSMRELGFIKDHIGERIEKARADQRNMVR